MAVHNNIMGVKSAALYQPNRSTVFFRKKIRAMVMYPTHIWKDDKKLK